VRSTTSYTWAHHQAFPTFPATEIPGCLEHAPVYWNQAEGIFGVPYHPNVSMAGIQARDLPVRMFQQGTYPYTPILKNNRPETFQQGLMQAKSFVERGGNQPRIITINAWNEWTEAVISSRIQYMAWIISTPFAMCSDPDGLIDRLSSWNASAIWYGAPPGSILFSVDSR